MGVRVLVFATLGLAVITIACHPVFQHVDGVHSDGDLENWCVQMHTQAMTDDAARQSVELFLEDNTLGWESRDTVNFFGAGSIECSQSVDRSNYEIEVHIWDSVVEDGPCPPGAQACVDYIDQGTNHGSNPTKIDHEKIEVNFNAADAIAAGDKWLFVGNHELGHVLGFADPTPVPGPNQAAEQCLINQDVPFLGAPFTVPVPVVSVMHDRHCSELTPGSDLVWPTIYDFISFDENVKPFP